MCALPIYSPWLFVISRHLRHVWQESSGYQELQTDVCVNGCLPTTRPELLEGWLQDGRQDRQTDRQAYRQMRTEMLVG